MSIKSGDVVVVQRDAGESLLVRAESTADGGKTWLCARLDGSEKDTLLVYSEDELLDAQLRIELGT